ncbi:hypothetical protein FD41_GL001567 [Lentilactobacillus farraginis DSM 18382 = JCM 14108]|uniref:Integral membrane protein n=1 Tax=Lentilactobacillus farraginis DSM 18382 = JCM 14108 TaxID=1423743 RepID=X0QFP0_9LACO|nr:hypothetical protein FD41_GL001567 [Lentilactobacillus farraginis DSM 18382 = JCM 14108]GAF37435.1 integral membrane protein [Lentilactobacillus farraginis DSM 18382 = JCM 14108]
MSSDSESKQESNARKKNANVRQDRDRAKKIVHSQFDNIGLTKRNADYMFRFNQEIAKTKLTPQQQADLVHQMVEALLTGQKSGKTARNMWGTVDQKVQSVLNPPKRPADPRRDYWPNAFYNMLLFFVIFTFLYGIMFFFSKGNARGTMGITGIVVTSIIAGLGIPAMTMLIQPGVKHKYPLWLRIIFMILFLVVWMGIFFTASFIPAVINPVLNPYVYIGLGVIGVVGAFFVKRNFRITGGLF